MVTLTIKENKGAPLQIHNLSHDIFIHESGMYTTKNCFWKEIIKIHEHKGEQIS